MIAYTHKTHPRSRSIKIKIEPSGDVVVVTPQRFSQRRIDAFVSDNAAWIRQQQQKIDRRKEFGVSADHVMLFGKKYSKKLQAHAELQRGVFVHGSQLILNFPEKKEVLTHASTQTTADTHIKRFLKNTASEYIIPRTHQLAEMMQISFGKITLRQQKTRWGSCSSIGNLNFNWRLVHAPIEVIDYVIIHELAHRTHMNHSAAFWQLVAKYDPEHQLHRGWLKRQGMAVG